MSVLAMIIKHKRTIPALIALVAIGLYMIPTLSRPSHVYEKGQISTNLAASSASSAPPLQPALHVTIQNTTTSSQDPLPGHQGWQLAMILPPRPDGKVWLGTVTWSSSKPVDLVVLHAYKQVSADFAHGVPFTARAGTLWGEGFRYLSR